MRLLEDLQWFSSKSRLKPILRINCEEKMNKAVGVILLTSLLGACSTFSTPTNYILDTSKLKGKGLTEDCTILVEKSKLTAQHDQKNWQFFHDCLTKYERLPSNTPFHWTTVLHLPEDSRLVGYIFSKDRLDITQDEKLDHWSQTALRNGANYLVEINPVGLSDGVEMIAVYRGEIE